MRLKQYIIFILLTSIFSFASVNAQSEYNNTFTKHTVKIGETAYSVAVAYQTTVDEIYKLNPESRSGVKIGQVLKVPVAVSEPVKNVSNSRLTHTIQPKETLFSVSQKYRITVSELLKANPGLSESTFSIGREINIPDIYTLVSEVKTNESSSVEPVKVKRKHQVKKQETLYSISKMYDCDIEEILDLNNDVKNFGLREGDYILIPAEGNRLSITSDYARSLYVDTSEFEGLPPAYQHQDGVVRIALLLPFIKGTKDMSAAKIAEYYEGFLLAVQRMKERGLNAEVYTFDIGAETDTKRLKSILGTYELNSLDLIIGGVSDKQVQMLSRFAKKTGTNYVVPFSNKNTGVEFNENIYQIANSHSSQYPEIAKAFAKKFRTANIIFLSEQGSDDSKMDFVTALQNELKAQNVAFKTTHSNASISSDLSLVFDKDKKNIIVPTSSSENSLKRITAVLDLFKKRGVNISLFGYPEWQTYANQRSVLHQYNSYMYGMFFLDEKEPEAMLFADRYKKWYNKSLVLSYPKFAHMGYDTGILFLTALQQSGRNFARRINALKTHTLQSALYFESIGEKGGYVNTGIYFVNLKPDGSVEKNVINR